MPGDRRPEKAPRTPAEELDAAIGQRYEPGDLPAPARTGLFATLKRGVLNALVRRTSTKR